MPPAHMPSLPRKLAAEQVRRARDLRRAGLVAVAIGVILGLFGFLGARSDTTTSSSDGYTLSVVHAVLTRAGLATPLRIEVTRSGGFADPVILRFSRGIFERFDFQNWYPNPSAETGSDVDVQYEFDPPPGDRLRVSLDARTSPDQNGSVESFQVTLVSEGRAVTAVRFRMAVMP